MTNLVLAWAWTSVRSTPPPSPSSLLQALTILVAQPLLLLLYLLASFVLWPPLAPLVVWLPGLGRLLGGAAVTDAYSAGPSGVLTRRLEHVRRV